MGGETARSSSLHSGFVIGLVAVSVLGCAVRWLAFEAAFPVKPLGDEMHYVGVAANIASGRGHVDASGARASWPPAHSWLLSLFLDGTPGEAREAEAGARRELLSAWERRAITGSQIALSSLLVVLVVLLGRALFDPATGVVAGGVAAVFPGFVAFSHYWWSENLFAVLVTAGVAAVVFGASVKRPSLAVLAGLLFGAAGLTREIGLVFCGVCAIWWVRLTPRDERSLAMRHAGVMLACAVLVVVPWTFRNYSLLDRLVPVSNAGWMGLREGNTLPARNWLRQHPREIGEFRRKHWAIPDELERADRARRESMQLIRDAQPRWLGVKLVRNLALLFNPDSMLLYKLRTGAYGPLPVGTVRALMLVSVLGYVMVCVAGVVGVAGSREAGRRALALGLFGALVVIHVVANANSRYRFPLMPLLIVYASHAALNARALRERLRGPSLVGALAVLVFFLAVCVPYLFVYGYGADLWRAGGPSG